MAKRKQKAPQTALDLKILVSAAKSGGIPRISPYFPVQVGHATADFELNAQKDDEGANISAQHEAYGELTAIYWAWKNLAADAVGHVPQDRYFLGLSADALTRGAFALALLGRGAKMNCLLTNGEAQVLLANTDVVLPKRRRYVVETMESHHAHAHGAEDMKLLREALAISAPEVLSAFEASMKRTSGHMFNMFLMKKAVFDKYCASLFKVLATCGELLEKRGETPRPGLYRGLAERLMDAFVETNGLSVKECAHVSARREFLPFKALAVLWRKYLGKHKNAHCGPENGGAAADAKASE